MALGDIYSWRREYDDALSKLFAELKRNPAIELALQPLHAPSDTRFSTEWIRGVDLESPVVLKYLNWRLRDFRIPEGYHIAVARLVIATLPVRGVDWPGEETRVSYLFTEGPAEEKCLMVYYRLSSAEAVVRTDEWPSEVEKRIVQLNAQSLQSSNIREKAVLCRNPFPQYTPDRDGLTVAETTNILETLLFRVLRRVPERVPLDILERWGTSAGWPHGKILDILDFASYQRVVVIRLAEDEYVYRRDYLDRLVFGYP